MKLIAYVDGSYNQETKISGAGIVFIYPDGNITQKGFPIEDKEKNTMRNVSGEIEASTCAIQLAMNKGFDIIEIHYDYDGISKWADGLWKTNNQWTKEYKEFVENARKTIVVSFVKEKAHSGCEYNDMADLIAKSSVGLLDNSSAFGLEEEKIVTCIPAKKTADKTNTKTEPHKYLYFVSVFSGYSVNRLKFPEFKDRCCVGFFEKLEEAEKIVLNNGGDIWETCYDYAVIEKIEYGLYPFSEVVNFYKYDMDKNIYFETELPAIALKTGGGIALA